MSWSDVRLEQLLFMVFTLGMEHPHLISSIRIFGRFYRCSIEPIVVEAGPSDIIVGKIILDIYKRC